MAQKTAGVLALQGDFEAHRKALERAAGSDPIRVIEVRTAEELESCDGVVLPGGESTTMMKLLDQEKLLDPLKRFGERKPIYGSCAGAIVLAREVTHPAQPSLGMLDIAVERNAYGRQLNSRISQITPAASAAIQPMEAVFIRAPIIRSVGKDVHVLAEFNGDPVWVEQGRHMVTTFHPELTPDIRVHRRFLDRL